MSSPLETAAEIAGEEQDLTHLMEIHEVSEQVRRAIATLHERERLVIFLFYGTGYALKEIAAFLDVPITSVKKRLYDARQHLKVELIDLMRDVLQEQRPSLIKTLPAKIRLLIAARSGDLDTVKMLLTQSPSLLNMRMEHKEVWQHRALTPVGMTALHEVAMHDHMQVASLLLDYGANINAHTSKGQTPLHAAVMLRCHATACVLLMRGANVELPLDNGLTALHLAAINGDIEMIHLLLTYGASIDSQSQHGRTPCHWAALKGHIEVVNLFLKYKASLSVRDCTGRTPYDWALVRGHTAVAVVLQERVTCQ